MYKVASPCLYASEIFAVRSWYVSLSDCSELPNFGSNLYRFGHSLPFPSSPCKPFSVSVGLTEHSAWSRPILLMYLCVNGSTSYPFRVPPSRSLDEAWISPRDCRRRTLPHLNLPKCLSAPAPFRVSSSPPLPWPDHASSSPASSLPGHTPAVPWSAWVPSDRFLLRSVSKQQMSSFLAASLPHSFLVSKEVHRRHRQIEMVGTMGNRYLVPRSTTAMMA